MREIQAMLFLLLKQTNDASRFLIYFSERNHGARYELSGWCTVFHWQECHLNINQKPASASDREQPEQRSWRVLILHRMWSHTSAERNHVQAATCVYSTRIIILGRFIRGKKLGEDCDFKVAARADLRRWCPSVLNCISLLVFCGAVYFWAITAISQPPQAGHWLMWFTFRKRTSILLFQFFRQIDPYSP